MGWTLWQPTRHCGLDTVTAYCHEQPTTRRRTTNKKNYHSNNWYNGQFFSHSLLLPSSQRSQKSQVVCIGIYQTLLKKVKLDKITQRWTLWLPTGHCWKTLHPIPSSPGDVFNRLALSDSCESILCWRMMSTRTQPSASLVLLAPGQGHTQDFLTGEGILNEGS